MSERVLAPIIVLALHGALLLDVACHAPRLRDWSAAGVGLEWCAAAAAVLAYLCVVTRDPGFLRAEPRPQQPPALLAAALALVALPLRRLAGRRGQARDGLGGAATRMDRAKSDSLELQPMGLAAFHAPGSFECDEDPGEEDVDLADLRRSAAQVIPADVFGAASEMDPGREAPRDTPATVQRKRPPIGQMRFCKQCQLHQPLRVKHCWDCGRCVRTHDHHCPWVGTCVAEGNRVYSLPPCSQRYFYWFLVTQTLELGIFLIEGFCALVAVERRGARAYPPHWAARRIALVLGLTLMLAFFAMAFALTCFHSYLAMANLTTWESVRWFKIPYLKRYDPELGSPFSVSLRWNLAAYCCPPWCAAYTGDEDASDSCTSSWGPPADLERTEDGWAVWRLREQHIPKSIDCPSCCPC